MVGPVIRCSSLPMGSAKSRYWKVLLLKNRKAETFNIAVIHFYQRLSEAMRLTLMVGHSRVQFYFPRGRISGKSMRSKGTGRSSVLSTYHERVSGTGTAIFIGDGLCGARANQIWRRCIGLFFR